MTQEMCGGAAHVYAVPSLHDGLFSNESKGPLKLDSCPNPGLVRNRNKNRNKGRDKIQVSSGLSSGHEARSNRSKVLHPPPPSSEAEAVRGVSHLSLPLWCAKLTSQVLRIFSLSV